MVNNLCFTGLSIPMTFKDLSRVMQLLIVNHNVIRLMICQQYKKLLGHYEIHNFSFHHPACKN